MYADRLSLTLFTWGKYLVAMSIAFWTSAQPNLIVRYVFNDFLLFPYRYNVTIHFCIVPYCRLFELNIITSPLSYPRLYVAPSSVSGFQVNRYRSNLP